MATASKTYTFTPATTVLASEANQNFDDVDDFLNNEVIHKDASVAFTGVPSGPATDPVSDNQFTRKAYVDTSPAQGILGKAVRTTDAGPDPFTDANPGTAISGLTKTLTTVASRQVRLRIQFRGALGTVAGDVFAVRIVEGTTVLQEALCYIATSAQGVGVPVVEVIIEPTAAEHTYFVTAKRLFGTGSATFYGSATYPAQLVIEDVGPA
jgi:hypothetical protein